MHYGGAERGGGYFQHSCRHVRTWAQTEYITQLRSTSKQHRLQPAYDWVHFALNSRSWKKNMQIIKASWPNFDFGAILFLLNRCFAVEEKNSETSPPELRSLQHALHTQAKTMVAAGSFVAPPHVESEHAPVFVCLAWTTLKDMGIIKTIASYENTATGILSCLW